MSIISSLIIPLIIILIILLAFYKKVNCFSAFKKGAEEGALTILKLIPTYVGLFVAISVFRESGAIDIIISFLSKLFNFSDVIANNLPLMFIRPVSGSASLAIVENIISSFGPDSKTATAAAIMMGSTETVIYTMSVYTNDTKIKRLPGVMPSALIANFVSCALAVFWVLVF